MIQLYRCQQSCNIISIRTPDFQTVCLHKQAHLLFNMLIRECFGISFVGVQEYLEEIFSGLVFCMKSFGDDAIGYPVHLSRFTWRPERQPFQERESSVYSVLLQMLHKKILEVIVVSSD